MIRSTIMGLGGVFLAGVVSAQIAAAQTADLPAGDPAAGRELTGQCRTCHGTDGFAKMAQAPHIGGQPERYLAAQLTAYHDGTRQQEMMSVVAQSLGPQQIADLAAWYASSTITATLTADAAGAPELCSGCHGADGLSDDPEVPNLAGVTNIYTLTQLKNFRSGQRENEVMSAIAAELSDEEMRAAADWYAAVKVEITAAE